MKLTDFFIFSDNNNNDDHVLNSISQNGKWISRVFSKELEVKAEKWNTMLSGWWSEKYCLGKSISKETSLRDLVFSLQVDPAFWSQEILWVLFMRIQAFLSSAFRLVHDHSLPWGFPGGSDGKEPASVQETRVWSLGQEDPLEKGMVTHPVFLPEEFHGQRSLVCYIGHGVGKSWTQLSN